VTPPDSADLDLSTYVQLLEKFENSDDEQVSTGFSALIRDNF
jgi:hypothetical protein